MICAICKTIFHVKLSHVSLRKTCSKACDSVNRSRRMTGIEKPKIDPQIRFLSKIEKTSTCWIWKGARFANGYGVFSFSHSRNMKAHRFSYEIYKGPIPSGKLVCHSCDVKLCVNPDHLWIGTQKENIRDCMNKNRAYCQRLTSTDMRRISRSRGGVPSNYRRRGRRVRVR